MTKVLLVIGALSLLPIWKVAGTKSDQGEGWNLWEYLRESTSDEYELRHVTYEEALNEARQAYQANNTS